MGGRLSPGSGRFREADSWALSSLGSRAQADTEARPAPRFSSLQGRCTRRAASGVRGAGDAFVAVAGTPSAEPRTPVPSAQGLQGAGPSSLAPGEGTSLRAARSGKSHCGPVANKMTPPRARCVLLVQFVEKALAGYARSFRDGAPLSGAGDGGGGGRCRALLV